MAAVATRHARTARHLRWTLVAACLLAAGRPADAQSEGKITVTSPDSDEEIHAGAAILVAFNASGDAVFGPYDIDLLKGNQEVQNWCSMSEGCDVDGVAEDGYGVVPVILSSTHEPGLGYTVRVTDRNSSISQSSFPFQVLSALPSNSSEEASPEYRDEVGGAEGVADMGLAMLVVATVCGVALACTLLGACCILCRRRNTKKMKDLDIKQDVESGGSVDRTTPGRMNDSSSNESRDFGSGHPAKTNAVGAGAGGAGPQGQYTPGRLSRGGSSSHMHPSPGRAMAMGEYQRGRSISRASPGPRMYSTTPGRPRGTSASPGQGSRRGYDSTPGRAGTIVTVTPGRSGGSRRERHMYNHSGGPSWDEAGGRMPSRSLGLARSKSTGRVRRPPRSASLEFGGEYGRDSNGLTTMTPGRRRHSGGDGRGYGRQNSSQFSGVRRSKSERHGYSPSQNWARQEELGSRWEDRDMAAAMGSMERGRRGHSQRGGFGSSMRSGSMQNGGDGRSPGSSGNSALDRSGSSRGRSTAPSRQRGYSGEMAANGVEMPPDVSWEELRSTYLRNKAANSRSGVRKSYSLPSYGDAVGENRPPPPSYSPNDAASSKGLSIGIPDDPKPTFFQGSKSARARQTILSGPLGSSRAPSTASKSPGRFGVSPGTRAVSARKAARDAQLSAERALAAAAMASRAADLAAQAALEAEAEADAELVSYDSYEEADGEEAEMSPPSKSSGGEAEAELSSSSVREKIKVFSGGGNSLGSSTGSTEKTPGRSPVSSSSLSRGWSQADEKEVKARAEQSSAKAKEALASFGRTASGVGRPDSSWLKDRVREPDTAGGSAHDGTVAAAAAAAPPEPEPLSSDPEQLAIKRRAFVQQYSQSGDSDFSLHDNAAAVAIAAAVNRQGSGASGQGHEELAREDYKQEQQLPETTPGTPKRGRSQLRAQHDGGSGDDERTRVRRRPSPGPSYTVAKEVHIHTVEDPSVLTMSDSGSQDP